LEAVSRLDIIQNLYQNYYGKDESIDAECLSSHWEHYSKGFDVKIDSSGQIEDFLGAGLGMWKWYSRSGEILDRLCINSYLLRLSEKKKLASFWKLLTPLCKQMGLDPTFDVFRQMCSAALIEEHWTQADEGRRLSIIIIGDGLGVLSGFIKKLYPESTIVLVDIGKTLLFQAFHLHKIYPDCHHHLVNDDTEDAHIDFLYCPAERINELSEDLRFDIAVNVASMQEMTVETVAHYFSYLRSHMRQRNIFYCCNREKKILPDGEVLEFYRYPWMSGDKYLVDEVCPWHRYFFARTQSDNGPILLGVRVPFVNYYDGDHMHRLAVLDTDIEVENRVSGGGE
jgi:hypothetical protein